MEAQEPKTEEVQYNIKLGAFRIGYIMGLLDRVALMQPKEAVFIKKINKDIKAQFDEQVGNTETTP